MESHEKEFYKQPWFWMCITIIVVCLTRGKAVYRIGNGCGNGCNNSSANKE